MNSDIDKAKVVKAIKDRQQQQHKEKKTEQKTSSNKQTQKEDATKHQNIKAVAMAESPWHLPVSRNAAEIMHRIKIIELSRKRASKTIVLSQPIVDSRAYQGGLASAQTKNQNTTTQRPQRRT